jgi:catechol 2,3-dioxygenase-like lactoylglutathione lyase family enzyme
MINQKMLGDKDAVANIAGKNLETAKKFYKETLGLKEVGAEDQELIVFKSGNSTVNVYRHNTQEPIRLRLLHG